MCVEVFLVFFFLSVCLFFLDTYYLDTYYIIILNCSVPPTLNYPFFFVILSNILALIMMCPQMRLSSFSRIHVLGCAILTGGRSQLPSYLTTSYSHGTLHSTTRLPQQVSDPVCPSSTFLSPSNLRIFFLFIPFLLS